MRFLPSKTDRAAFGEIASEYDLVYFGRVDPREDSDYTQVAGLTIAPKIVDENYTTGNVYDYEVAFLQRSRTVFKHKSGAETAATRWTILQNAVKKTLKKSDVAETETRKRTILQVKLKFARLPHVFVCGRARLEDYLTLLNSAERWQEIGWQNLPGAANNFGANSANSANNLNNLNSLNNSGANSANIFAQNFATFIVPTHIAWLPYVLPPAVQTMLSANFAQFDFEIFENNLLIYATDEKISLEILDHMLRVGLWWARNLDAIFAQNS